MTTITDLPYGAPVETACIDCGEPVTVDPLTDDPETARCQSCAFDALPADVQRELMRLAANEYGRGLIPALRAKAAALESNAA